MKEHKSRVAETPDDDPRDGDEPDYEQQWEQLDEKTLLASILAEQQRTNQLLAQLTDSGGDTTEQAATPMHECKFCGDTIKEDIRQRHAESEHNTPPGEWSAAFERVE